MSTERAKRGNRQQERVEEHECICGEVFDTAAGYCPVCREPVVDDGMLRAHDQHDAKQPRQGCRYCLARGWVQS